MLRAGIVLVPSSTYAKRLYRAIYRVGDAQVGVWSNSVEIMVGG